MNKKIVIAISGKKRCGKNTAAQFIKDLLKDREFVIEEMAFAEPVKRVAAIMMGLSEDYFFDDDVKEELFSFYNNEEMTGREIMQKMGTEALRDNFNDSVWLTSMVNRISHSIADIILITDLRFPNELDFIRNQEYGISIRINRGDILNSDTHYSETALDGEIFDFFINNDKGSVKYLKKEIENILKQIVWIAS